MILDDSSWADPCRNWRHTTLCSRWIHSRRMAGDGRTPTVGIKALSRESCADGYPVSDVVVLLVPAWANSTHLHLLADVTQRFCDHHFP
jgi:hypothetical protein